MSTISASPTHADAVRAFVVAALNRNDLGVAIAPAPFTLGSATTPSNVIWSDRDMPRPPNVYAMLREVSHVEVGPTEVVDVPATPGPDIDQHLFETAEWTVAVQLVARQDTDAPSHAANAGNLLQRVSRRVWSRFTDAMSRQGCAPMRRGQILPLPRLARGSQWETRASLDLVFSVGSVIVDPAVGYIQTVGGTGTLSPLPSGPGEPGQVPFTATDPDP